MVTRIENSRVSALGETDPTEKNFTRAKVDRSKISPFSGNTSNYVTGNKAQKRVLKVSGQMKKDKPHQNFFQYTASKIANFCKYIFYYLSKPFRYIFGGYKQIKEKDVGNKSCLKNVSDNPTKGVKKVQDVVDCKPTETADQVNQTDQNKPEEKRETSSKERETSSKECNLESAHEKPFMDEVHGSIKKRRKSVIGSDLTNAISSTVSEDRSKPTRSFSAVEAQSSDNTVKGGPVASQAPPYYVNPDELKEVKKKLKPLSETPKKSTETMSPFSKTIQNFKARVILDTPPKSRNEGESSWNSNEECLT